MGKLSRNKGRAWEQEVARGLRAIFGEEVKRGWQARSGSDASDIENAAHFYVEAKHHKVVNIYAAVKQVLTAQKTFKDDRWPLVVSKSNRAEPLATMLWVDFLKLLTEWWELKNAQLQVVKKLVDTKPTRAVLEAEYEKVLAHAIEARHRLSQLVEALKPLAVEINDAADTDTRWEAVQKAYDVARGVATASEAPRT